LDFVRPGLRPLAEALGLAPGKVCQNLRDSGRETSSHEVGTIMSRVMS
jgi:hypothetical protein